jgi:hypothetical protein
MVNRHTERLILVNDQFETVKRWASFILIYCLIDARLVPVERDSKTEERRGGTRTCAHRTSPLSLVSPPSVRGGVGDVQTLALVLYLPLT